MTETVRTLSPAERRLWMCVLARHRRRASRVAGRVALAELVVMSLLCAASLFLSEIPWPIVVGFWLAVGVVTGLWNYSSETRRSKGLIGQAARVLTRNEVFETTIRSTAMVEFEEEEDLGARYAFQISDYRITLVTGQDFYPSARFPNTDFSIVDVRNDAGQTTDRWIVKRGRKLSPVRVVPAKMAQTLAYPRHLQTIAGRLEDLEQILSRPEP